MSREPREVKNARERARHRRLVADGICPRCGKPSDGRYYCPECSAFRREVYRMDRELGLCYICEKAAAQPGRGTCFACALRISQRYYALKIRREKSDKV